MAADKNDNATQTLPGLDITEKQYVRGALEQMKQSFARQRDKYPPGSKMYDAITADVAVIAKIQEKFA